MRKSRRVVGIVFVAVIVLNLWYLGRTEVGVREPIVDSAPKSSWNEGTPPVESTLLPPAAETAKEHAKEPVKSSKEPVNEPVNEYPPSSVNEEKAPEMPNEVEYLYNHGQEPPKYKEGISMIQDVIGSIIKIAPGAGPFTPEKDYIRDIKNDTPLEGSGELPATSEIMGMYLQVSESDVKILKKSHAKVFSMLPDKVPDDSFGGRGVVMTGGGKYFPMVLTAIKWLREVDPLIPVEVFMADDSEYEPEFCDKLFPSINVECRVVRDIYGSELSDKLNSKYALKPLAILASKFDDIYFMDADSYPLANVGNLFDWEVYQERGLIMNADYWPRYISPKFYEIVDRKLGGRVAGDGTKDHALLQADRENAIPGRSTESGQIFIRKSQHIKSLILATYYNLFGPDVYFPLLMQNGHGEGDKDTYIAAAVICDEPYYQTLRNPATLGYHDESGYHGYSMVQPNPVNDYSRNVLEQGDEVPDTMFALHANGIKSNAKYLLMDHNDPIRGAPMLRQSRMFGTTQNVRDELRLDIDAEHRLFRVMRDVACDWVVAEGHVPLDWKDEDHKRLCRLLTAHTSWLAKNPDVIDPTNSLRWFDLDRNGLIPD